MLGFHLHIALQRQEVFFLVFQLQRFKHTWRKFFPFSCGNIVIYSTKNRVCIVLNCNNNTSTWFAYSTFPLVQLFIECKYTWSLSCPLGKNKRSLFDSLNLLFIVLLYHIKKGNNEQWDVYQRNLLFSQERFLLTAVAFQPLTSSTC